MIVVIETLSEVTATPSKIVTKTGEKVSVKLKASVPISYVSYHLEDSNHRILSNSSGLISGSTVTVEFNHPGNYYLVVSGYKSSREYIGTTYIPVTVNGEPLYSNHHLLLIGSVVGVLVLIAYYHKTH